MLGCDGIISTYESPKDYPYFIIEKIAEWHIDFKGLIVADLAYNLDDIEQSIINSSLLRIQGDVCA